MNMVKLAAVYDEHAKNCDEDDIWGQVRRTVNGKPVSPDQIDMIVNAMISALDLGEDDVLLDICCGNGALSGRFFEQCAGGLGVDYSETMIAIAKKRFSRGPSVAYQTGDAIAFLRDYAGPEKFSKALIYGSINFFPRHTAEELLSSLRLRFSNIKRFVVGNVADKAHLRDFFGDRYEPGIENLPDSAIGVWWSKDEFASMALRAGWTAEFRGMPTGFFASHYRFDAVLYPA